MNKSQSITKVGFKPPADQHLVVEAMSIAELKKRAPADHFKKLQRADFYRLIGVARGHTTVMVDFADHAAHAKDWLLVRPGQVMRYDFSTDWAGWLLVFQPEGLFNFGRNFQTNEARLSQQLDDLACMHALDARQHEWITKSVGQMLQDSGLKLDASLRNELLRLQLASTLLRLSVWQQSRFGPALHRASTALDFKRFQQQIEADFAMQHQAQYYASALCMSDKSLGRLCLAATGVSAKSWISQRVCLEAKRLLAHTSMTVQSIGYTLGFEDASNFVKFFRKQAGLTPLSFRQDNSSIRD